MGIDIIGAGMYVPERIVDNEAFTKIVDTSDEWITSRTGIKKRHITDGILAYQMGTIAAKQAVARAGIAPEEIDLILATTCTSDFLTPSLACMVGSELGLTDVPAMDLNVACAAFVFAIDVAKKYLDSGECKNILIISSELVTRMVDYEDRSTCVLLGDGAAAAVVTSGEGIYSSVLRGDPSGAHKIFTKVPAPTNPFGEMHSEYPTQWMEEAPVGYMQMAGNDVYKFATTAMPVVIEQAVEKAGISVQDLDLIIPHQANFRIVQTAMKRLKVPMEKCYVNIQDFGNISSACIPLALTQLSEAGTLKKGDKLCLVGFGAGLVYGACVIEW